MAQSNNEIVINRPLEFVFQFMTEKIDDYLVRLNPTLLIVEQISEGEIGVGSQFRLISSKSSSDRDPTKTELIRGLDVDALTPELRSEIIVAFVEVTAFEKKKLLEFIRVDEDNQRMLERYTFRASENATILSYSPGYKLSEAFKVFKSAGSGKTKISTFAFKLLAKPLMKFGMKLQLKDLKTIIEAEPEV